jgi:hypothetical protein
MRNVSKRLDGLQTVLFLAPVWILVVLFDDPIMRASPTGSLNTFLLDADSLLSGLVYQVPEGCPDEPILRARVSGFELLAWLIFFINLSVNAVAAAYIAKRVDVGVAVAKINIVHFVIALALLMILTQISWVNDSLDALARYRWDVREVSCFKAPTRLPVFIFIAALISIMAFSHRVKRRIQPD